MIRATLLILALTFSAVPFISSGMVGQIVFPSEDGIIGPSVVQVGELARLQVKGDLVDWDCIPKSKDGQAYGENNQKFVISFRKPGEYDIVAAVYADGSVNIQQLHIKVSGVPQIEDPDLDEPVEVMLGSDPEVVEKAQSWCEGLAKDKVGELGAVFQLVCEGIHSGSLNDGNSVISETFKLSESVNLEGLDSLVGEIQALITSTSDRGGLESIDQYYVLWRSIAEGLAKYATS